MRLLLLFLLLLNPLMALAEDAEIAPLFEKQGVEGTLVLASLATGEVIIHNEARAIQRFAPASTFKVLNTLIAVQEGVVQDKDSPFKWDGHVHEIPEWNRDQTLESAFRVSCVWCYQEIAERVGKEKYRHYLQAAEYGNLLQTFDLTTFWLEGTLRISALEQVAFIKKVVLRMLPFSPASYDTLRDIMLAESAAGYSLYAKTGWAVRTEPQIGWYVGYVETAQGTWFFATNITIRTPADLPLRQQLTREALEAKGIIPAK
jgi:beta-lactamase class D